MARLIDEDEINMSDISPVDGFSVYGATAEDIRLTPTADAVSRSKIDEMITEIENCSETYVVGWNGKRSKTAKEMKQDILEIIHNYCDKNQKGEQ